MSATEARVDPKLEVYREIFANAHDWLEGTVADLTPEQAAWQPPGRAHPAGAHYAHHLWAEDLFINFMDAGNPPLFMTEFKDRTGMSELPEFGEGGDWSAWARRVKIDLPVMREYAQAVYANTDAFLSRLTSDDLATMHETTRFGFPADVPTSVMLNLISADAAAHCGEISCLKGLQDARGYPF